MTLFDAYLFVDWSARHGLMPREPAADAVWVGELIPSLNPLPTTTYHRSRHAAISAVLASLVDHIKHQRRVLVGFDFPYGYPSGLSRALGLGAGNPKAWLSIWAELARRVQDTASNENNRFAAAGHINKIAGQGLPGPFWGCPTTQMTPNLQPRSPGFPFPAANGVSLPRLRIVDRRLQGVQEAWKLFGVGSVGSQALVGIPWLHRLRQHEELRQHTKVWPFETHFTTTPTPKHGPCVVHAEIWPGVVKRETQLLMKKDPKLIKDQAQVMAMCVWASGLDNKNELGPLFGNPTDLSSVEVHIQSCVEQEG